jgi:hypothetical protein
MRPGVAVCNEEGYFSTVVKPLQSYVLWVLPRDCVIHIYCVTDNSALCFAPPRLRIQPTSNLLVILQGHFR